MNLDPVVIWFLAGLALILAEFALPGVVLVFFGVGAWLTALAAWLGLVPGWPGQLLLFGASSALLVLLLRRRLRLRFFGHVGAEQDPVRNLDEMTGDHVVVTTAIVPGAEDGRVEYKGAEWRARAAVALAAGQPAEIAGVDGITLIVRPRG